ncbi:MAG: hypothetical protein A2V66_17065 [Ignavibacteria bacterium RBG_13_36_8]|nr:MAG: hypothetical protein A2V66_17065 [Ignavibacteria bacterium RBG_13_36_8]
MKFFNWQNLKKSFLYVTPNFPAIQTKRYKFSVLQLVYVILGYSFFTTLLVITLLALTPAKELIFIFENEELKKQAAKIKELETKVVFLTSNLETLASTNKKLKFAMMLAGTDTLDSTAAIYDSLRIDELTKMPAGGNLLQAIKKLLNGDEKQPDDSANYFIKPVKGFIVNQFNPEKGHMGIDFAVKNGTPIFATAGGLVLFAEYTTEDGYMLMIQHDNNLISVYKHCSILLKKERDYLVQGELIALSGNTGYNTTGSHLHFEIWKQGKVIDPTKYLIN